MKIDEVLNRVVEIEKLNSAIVEQQKNQDEVLDSLDESRKENIQHLNDLRREGEKETIALKKDIDELRRWTEKNATSELKAKLDVLTEKVLKVESAQEKMGTRAWSVVPNVVGAIVNVILAAIVAFIVTRAAK